MAEATTTARPRTQRQIFSTYQRCMKNLLKHQEAFNAAVQELQGVEREWEQSIAHQANQGGQGAARRNNGGNRAGGA